MITQNNCLTNPMEKTKQKEEKTTFCVSSVSSQLRNQVVVFTLVVNQRKPNQKEREIP